MAVRTHAIIKFLSLRPLRIPPFNSLSWTPPVPTTIAFAATLMVLSSETHMAGPDGKCVLPSHWQHGTYLKGFATDLAIPNFEFGHQNLQKGL
jgi:hypothetical protein